MHDAPLRIFLAAIHRNVELRHPDPMKNPVISMRVDRITHVMWDVVFENEEWMKQTTTKASMLPQIKLRALAKLNYLPSWWILRDMARMVMMRQGWLLEDREMQTLWNNTVEWSRKAEHKFGMQSDQVMPVNKGVREESQAQQQATNKSS